ncbi:uncharacterized protein A1O9_05509 [Exophiala aquamarina CBS 119918]|uniref:Uncharacterized protein n=1 Tax=Exophiala aquamarina CBS 119918 TaxID=1182545 RepID=A0A072PCK0_9EURO|nr:uncharacterized protein A1O9_05509 [Exophiala aquamarina CBS 119918]KEF57591.1 hypothetical protein A1O9_05509 [Exophiala aquamarina CBS 119918]
MGSSFLEVLHDPLTRKLLGFDAVHAEKTPFIGGVTSRLKFLLNDATTHLSFLKIGYTALEAFLQANCTGPPLDFNPEESIFPEVYWNDGLKILKEELFQSLAVDGSGPYPLTPHIELFWLAKLLTSDTTLAEAGFNGRRARFRVNFWHQKLLSEESPSLRSALYSDAEILEHQLSSRLAYGGAAAEEHFVEFLVERALVKTHYGDDQVARVDLAHAATTRQFQFALSGVLGKRTKFQDRDITQLVVLAKSRDHEPEPYSSRKSSRAEASDSRKSSAVDTGSASRHPRPKSPNTPISPPPTSVPYRSATPTRPMGSHEHLSRLASPITQPENILLNDDTLLERIHFKQTLVPMSSDNMTQVVPPESALPPQLAALDPANQPLLFPMDSIILLATASSISNTSPSDGLVREETLPYATRVLDGGSSNWQVYTQALLVRSRIEGYRSRTTERGLLQLQALVDQVIAETSEAQPSTSSNSDPDAKLPAANTFLPKASASESATVAERLRYIYQLSPPLRWELEAELAARWTHMGGLKTALEIYERLQMHAEVALCLAATDREGDAIKLLKSMLFEDVTASATTAAKGPAQENGGGSDETISLKFRTSPPPTDAPRLLCILGDITSHPSYYDLAWTASGNRYARAQRSLGRHFTKKRDFPAAAKAFTLALGVTQVDRSCWFSLGCVQLELEDWMGAVESFTRCVQLEDSDGESWSNMAVALLKLPPPQSSATEQQPEEDKVPQASDTPDADHDHDEPPDPLTQTKQQQLERRQRQGPYAHTFSALRALRRAATLKRDDARIWDNYLTVAASIPPSAGTPWSEIIQAMGRVIELRGKREGEGCIDLNILKVLVEYITAGYDYPAADGGSETSSSMADDKAEPGIRSETKAIQQPPTEKSATSITTPSPTPARLLHLPASLLHLIDTQITPLATSSPSLYLLLTKVSTWRHRPTLALSQAEKSWRLRLTTLSPSEDFGSLSQTDWESVVNKTIWLMRVYKELGPKERERTGGVVESKWAFKARTAARRVLGRAKDTWEGSDGWVRLEGEVEGLRGGAE